MDESRLVRRSQTGDKRAFERLFEAHRDSIFGLAWHHLSDQEAAEELTVEAFVRAWERLPQLEAPEAFPLWLRRIALNLSRDALRRRRREAVVQPDEGELEQRPAPGKVSDGMMRDELASEIRAALAELPEHYRQAAILHYMDDQPVKAISEILKIPVGTVLSRLARARDALRHKLSAYVEGRPEEDAV